MIKAFADSVVRFYFSIHAWHFILCPYIIKGYKIISRKYFIRILIPFMSVPPSWHKFILMVVNYYYHHFACYTFLTKSLWEEANTQSFVQLKHSLDSFSLCLNYYILILIVIIIIYQHNFLWTNLVNLVRTYGLCVLIMNIKLKKGKWKCLFTQWNFTQMLKEWNHKNPQVKYGSSWMS